MKSSYRLYRRKGIYYVHDAETGKQKSLGTRDRKEAERLAMALNESRDNKLLNYKIAEAHLAAQDPAMTKRTWQDVMDYWLAREGQVRQSTLDRAAVAFKSKPFDLIRDKKIVQTVSDDFLKVLKAGGTSTNVWLRIVHGCALRLDWLLRRVLAEEAWPPIKYGITRAITWDEHQQILAKERNAERRLYYEVLWQTGGAPVDIANITDDNIDWSHRVLQFYRQKLNNQKEPACIQIGTELEKALRACPITGHLFPTIQKLDQKNRSGEFRRRCKTLKLSGIKLYSYRYAWAERAKACGYPERFAMVNLGHDSKAIHRAYAKKARVVCPSLESVEQDFKAKKIVKFTAEEEAA
jgi:hypothetical protein